MTHEEIKDWERRVDEQLLEEEQANEQAKAFSDTLGEVEAELALQGLQDLIHTAGHPPIEELVMGWERYILDGGEDEFHWDVI